MYVHAQIILDAITRVTGITHEELRSPARPRRLADARKIAAWHLRHRANLTDEASAAMMCRERSSASWAVYACEDGRATDPNFRRLFDAVSAAVAGRERAA